MSGELNRLFGSCWFGVFDGNTSVSATIDSQIDWGVSGDAVGLRFIAPVSITNSSFEFNYYVTNVVNTTGITATLCLRPTQAADPDRPHLTTVIGTPVSQTPVDDTWNTLIITDATLVEGEQYYAILYSTDADASNNFDVCRRGVLDTPQFNEILLSSAISCLFSAFFNIDGFVADVTNTVATAPFCISMGGVIVGMPYIATSIHASDTNYRGNRYNFNVDINVSGFLLDVNAPAITATIGVYQNTTTIIQQNATYTSTLRGVRTKFTAKKLAAKDSSGTSLFYDVLLKPVSASTLSAAIWMGELVGDLPATVLACRLGSYVDGAVLGSLTEDTTRFWRGAIELDSFAPDFPVVGNVTEDDTVNGVTGTYHEATAAEVQSGVQFGAGGTEYTGTYVGGGGGLIRHPGMSGGLNG